MANEDSKRGKLQPRLRKYAGQFYLIFPPQQRQQSQTPTERVKVNKQFWATQRTSSSIDKPTGYGFGFGIGYGSGSGVWYGADGGSDCDSMLHGAAVETLSPDCQLPVISWWWKRGTGGRNWVTLGQLIQIISNEISNFICKRTGVHLITTWFWKAHWLLVY